MVYKIDYSKVSATSYVLYAGSSPFFMVAYSNGQYILSSGNGNGNQYNNSTLVISGSSMYVTWYVKTSGNTVTVKSSDVIQNGVRVEFFY